VLFRGVALAVCSGAVWGGGIWLYRCLSANDLLVRLCGVGFGPWVWGSVVQVGRVCAWVCLRWKLDWASCVSWLLAWDIQCSGDRRRPRLGGGLPFNWVCELIGLECVAVYGSYVTRDSCGPAGKQFGVIGRDCLLAGAIVCISDVFVWVGVHGWLVKAEGAV